MEHVVVSVDLHSGVRVSGLAINRDRARTLGRCIAQQAAHADHSDAEDLLRTMAMERGFRV